MKRKKTTTGIIFAPTQRESSTGSGHGKWRESQEGGGAQKNLLVKIFKFLSYNTIQYKIYQHSPVGLFGVHHLKTTIQSLLNYNKPRKKLQYVKK